MLAGAALDKLDTLSLRSSVRIAKSRAKASRLQHCPVRFLAAGPRRRPTPPICTCDEDSLSSTIVVATVTAAVTHQHWNVYSRFISFFIFGSFNPHTHSSAPGNRLVQLEACARLLFEVWLVAFGGFGEFGEHFGAFAKGAAYEARV